MRQVLYNFKARQLVAKGGKGGKDFKPDKNLQSAAKEYEECCQNNPVPEVMLHLARVQKLMAQVRAPLHATQRDGSLKSGWEFLD